MTGFGSRPDYPLVLRPVYKDKVWGGRALERLGRVLSVPETGGVGESWEVADLARTARSGGGGGAEHSVIENGPLAGATLDDVRGRWRDVLLGPVPAADDGGFPLLVKYLDARSDLSVQVHPSPSYAAEHPDARLKSEAWYVVDAREGAVLYLGFRDGVTPAEAERALRAGTEEAVLAVLNAVPARPGAMHYLPSGLCHALGAGVLVAEVQTPSDTTYRLYDWGRVDRETHLEQGIAAMEFGARARSVEPAATPPSDPDFADRLRVRPMARAPAFDVDEWRMGSRARSEWTPSGPEVWMVVDGSLTVSSTEAAWPDVTIPRGRTALLPAAVGAVEGRAAAPGALALRVTFPLAHRHGEGGVA